MPNIDFSGGAYRDSTRGATIKALQLRQQKLQEETMAAQAPRQIASPWQGAAQIADVIGSGIREGRNANLETAGRKRFAELMAGGLTPDEMGEAISLDPETAMAYQKNQWDVSAAAANVQAQKDAATQQQGAAAALQTNQQAASAEAAKLTAAAKVAADNFARSGAVADRDLAEQSRQAAAEASRKADMATAEQTAETNKAAAATKAGVDVEAAKTAAEQPATGTGKAMAEYQRGTYGPVGSPEAIVRRDAEIRQGTFIQPTPMSTLFTPGQAATDTDFAKTANEWKQSGGANAVKSITQVNKAIDILKTSGPTGLWAGIQDQVLPDSVKAWVNPDANTARAAIRETVQSTLRQVLGAQFTETEGQDLMNRAFDISVAPAENLRRAKLVLDQVTSIAANKQAMVDYFDKKGSLVGYTGPQLDIGALSGLDFGDTRSTTGAPPAPADNGPIVTIRRKAGT